MKIKCLRCQEIKPCEEFYKRDDTEFGYKRVCISCVALVGSKNRNTNKENNKLKINTDFYKNCCDCGETKHCSNFSKNSTKYDGYHNSCKDCVRIYQRKYKLNRYKTDHNYVIKSLIKSCMLIAFKMYSKNGKTKSCQQYGIDFEAIYDKLGPRPGSGEFWHLDHIIPVSIFDLDNPEHVKLAYSPENLRWLNSTENIKKSDNIIEYVFENEKLLEIYKKIIGS